MATRNFVQISPKILEPRLPELGQIKIGGKGQERQKKSGRGTYRVPVKYDHFLVTQRTRDPKTDNLLRDEAVHRLPEVGATPTELDVRLLFDRPEQNFQFFLAAYDGRRQRCTGDGEQAHDAVHGEIPCTCPWFKFHEGEYAGPPRPLIKEVEFQDDKGKTRTRKVPAPVCKPHGRLSVILEAAKSYGGFYIFRTTSWETIRSIAAQLDLFLQQFGFLAGLPLQLVMYPTTDTYEEDGALKTSTSYKVALVLRGSFDTARQLAAAAYERREALALPTPQQAETHMRQLRAAEERDAAAIAAEFHPETADDQGYARVIEDDEATVIVQDDADTAAEADAQYLEDLCRMTLDLADWEQDRINRQIAKSSANLEELAQTLKERLPGQYQMAEERLRAAAEQDEGTAAEEDSEAPGDKPAAATAPEQPVSQQESLL